MDEERKTDLLKQGRDAVRRAARQNEVKDNALFDLVCELCERVHALEEKDRRVVLAR